MEVVVEFSLMQADEERPVQWNCLHPLLGPGNLWTLETLAIFSF